MRSLLKTLRRTAAARPTPRVPEGTRLYAVGDIHGRIDLLDALLARIDDDEKMRGGPRAGLIFLGDLIDRGPASAQVVERLRLLAAERPDTRFLMGNHEEVFLNAVGGDVKALRFFDRIGGRETMLSYGMDEAAYRACDFDGLMTLLQQVVPAEHVAFLRTFGNMIVEGDYAFVHAGINPARPLADQQVRDLRWMRDPFLDHRGMLERRIVHGHTIAEAVVEKPHRIGIDTGAYLHGRLTALGLEADQTWVIDVTES